MSIRKTPYKHKVGDHLRRGRPVRNYKRGKGNKPILPRGRRQKPPRGKGTVFQVTMIGDKGNESYNVSATTLTAAVKAGLARLQMAVIPRRIVVRRL